MTDLPRGTVTFLFTDIEDVRASWEGATRRTPAGSRTGEQLFQQAGPLSEPPSPLFRSTACDLGST